MNPNYIPDLVPALALLAWGVAMLITCGLRWPEGTRAWVLRAAALVAGWTVIVWVSL